MTLSMAVVSVMIMFPKSDFKGRRSRCKNPVARQSSAVRRSLEATAEIN
jgi:hypothetical protein